MGWGRLLMDPEHVTCKCDSWLLKTDPTCGEEQASHKCQSATNIQTDLSQSDRPNTGCDAGCGAVGCQPHPGAAQPNNVNSRLAQTPVVTDLTAAACRCALLPAEGAQRPLGHLLHVADSQCEKRCDKDLGGCNLPAAPRKTLELLPQVLTLLLGWEENVRSLDIKETMYAVKETCRAGDIYPGAIPQGGLGSAPRLRCDVAMPCITQRKAQLQRIGGTKAAHAESEPGLLHSVSTACVVKRVEIKQSAPVCVVSGGQPSGGLPCDLHSSPSYLMSGRRTFPFVYACLPSYQTLVHCECVHKVEPLSGNLTARALVSRDILCCWRWLTSLTCFAAICATFLRVRGREGITHCTIVLIHPPATHLVHSRAVPSFEPIFSA